MLVYPGSATLQWISMAGDLQGDGRAAADLRVELSLISDLEGTIMLAASRPHEIAAGAGTVRNPLITSQNARASSQANTGTAATAPHTASCS
jgi:hypothetical protein